MKRTKKLSFTAKPYRQGQSSYVVVIPLAYIKNKLINPNKEYKFEVREIETNKRN